MELLYSSTPIPCDLQSAQVFPHKSNSTLVALVALSTHVKDLGFISLTSTHEMCHEFLITLGITSICKLLVPLFSQSHKVLYISD